MSENDLSTIARFQLALPSLRTSLGLTQLDLAKYLDIRKLTIQIIESYKKPTTVVFYWAILGVLNSLAAAKNNVDFMWMAQILINLPDEKLRSEALDICNMVVKQTDEIGIAKAQDLINETFHKWVQDNIEPLKLYFGEGD